MFMCLCMEAYFIDTFTEEKNHSDVKNAILSTSTWLSYLTNSLVQHIKPEKTKC